MTENEAIRDLQYLIGEYSVYPPETGVNATVGSLQYCISALKEIQQYREIGTVEECREAVEKQKVEKIEYETNAVFNNGFGHYRMGKCPICDSRYNSNDEINYCSKCGKKLDWSEENE